MARKNRKKKKPITTVRPTDERLNKSPAVSAGMAMRFVPVIDTLKTQNRLTPQEHSALKTYADRAIAADRSPVRSCCDNTVGGGGEGPSARFLAARSEVTAMEVRMGHVAPLARFVCVDDRSLTEWCIERYGGRERVRSGRVEIQPRKDGLIQAALIELKEAARRLDLVGGM